MSDLRKARELEDLKWFKLIERLNTEEREQIERIKADATRRGVYHSGGTMRAIANARVEKLKAMVDGRIEIRKYLAAELPDLGVDNSIEELLVQMNRTIETAMTALHTTMPDVGSPAIASAIAAHDDQEALHLKAYAKSGFEILKREIALNLHKKPEPAAAVSVNTSGGPALVNLGNIYGDVRQIVGNIGNAELANSLRQLAEAIIESDDIGDERAAYLEQVRFIAEQSIAPENTR